MITILRLLRAACGGIFVLQRAKKMSASKSIGRLTACSLLALLSACATPPVYNIGPSSAPGTHSAGKVVIADNRPESDKANSVGSFYVGSKDYGILTLGDVSFSPQPIEALRQSVQQSASTVPGNIPQQIEIKVERMIVQDNRKQLLLAQGSRGLLLAEVVGEALSGETIDPNRRDPFFIATFQGAATIDGVTKNISISRRSNSYAAHENEAREKRLKETMGDFLQAITAQITGGSNHVQRPAVVRTNNPGHVPTQGVQPVNSGSPPKPAHDKISVQKFGKYSYQIEQMAKSVNCRSGSGAYLTTDAGPIEGYRIDCEGGGTYLGRCEYGICTAQ